MLSNFTKYVKQIWKNKPDTSSPLNATRLNHIEDGIENNSNAISELDTSVTELTEKRTDEGNWVLLHSSNSKSVTTKSVDMAPYRFIAFEIQFYNSVCSQVILPINRVSNIRALSAFVDSTSNIAIVLFSGTKYNTTSIAVLSDVGSAITGNVYGIK